MFWKRSGASNLVGGIATNEITAIGSGSAEAEAVEAASKPTASKTLDKTCIFIAGVMKFSILV